VSQADMQDSPELEALFDSIAQATRAEQCGQPPAGSADMLTEVGHLTRRLHDALRGLGYDKVIAGAAEAVPDARQRLSYVAETTERAAERCLNAIEAAKPAQDTLCAEAKRLAAQWDRLLQRELTVGEFRELALGTRSFLRTVPDLTGSTNAQLHEIMMAQDFQDLTGQVIRKVMDIAQDIEKQLVLLLVEHAPPEKREAVQSAGLLNGPVTRAGVRTDVVTSQSQVDELLESLGF
jgi:chemotaxis protein CheZ